MRAYEELRSLAGCRKYGFGIGGFVECEKYFRRITCNSESGSICLSSDRSDHNP